MAKPRVGFDIGTNSVKIALMEGSGVKRLVIEPLPQDLIREGRIVSYDAMADFLKQTVRKHRVSGQSCAMVLPQWQAHVRRLTIPKMTQAQLKVNLPYEFRDYLSGGKDLYFYDYAVNTPLVPGEEPPDELDLTAAAILKQDIDNYLDLFRRIGFKLRVAVPPECACSNLLRSAAGSLPRELCILDLGHTATRVHIFSGHRWEATRIVELGCAQIDEAIAESFGVDEFVAGTYKNTNYGSAQSCEPAQQVYAAIAVEIMKVINFYRFSNRESELRDVYCCSGGALIQDLLRAIEAQAIQSSLNLELHPIQELLPQISQGDKNAVFSAGAVGALLQ